MNDVFNAPTKKDLVQDRELIPIEKNISLRGYYQAAIKSWERINVSTDGHDEQRFQRSHKKGI